MGDGESRRARRRSYRVAPPRPALQVPAALLPRAPRGPARVLSSHRPRVRRLRLHRHVAPPPDLDDATGPLPRASRDESRQLSEGHRVRAAQGRSAATGSSSARERHGGRTASSISRSFGLAALAGLVPHITAGARDFAERMEKRVGEPSFDIVPEMARVAMDIACRAFFGDDILERALPLSAALWETSEYVDNAMNSLFASTALGADAHQPQDEARARDDVRHDRRPDPRRARAREGRSRARPADRGRSIGAISALSSCATRCGRC